MKWGFHRQSLRSEFGGALHTALIGLTMLGAGATVMQSTSEKAVDQISIYLLSESKKSLEDQIRNVAASGFALQATAQKAGLINLKGCLDGTGACTPVGKTPFTLFDGNGVLLGGPEGNAAKFDKFGNSCDARSQHVSPGNACPNPAFRIHTSYEISTDHTITVSYEIDPVEGNREAKMRTVTGSESVAALICPPDPSRPGIRQVLVGIVDGKAQCAGAPNGVVGLQGPQGPPGDQGPNSYQRGPRGPRGTLYNVRLAGCFHPDTKILLENGMEKLVSDLHNTDKVYNPVTGRSYEIERIVRGEEDEPLLVFTVQGRTVRVTQYHPMPLQTGLTVAKDVKVGDLLRLPGGFAPVEKVQHLLPAKGLRVYNVALKTNRVSDDDHFLVADGIVTGDLVLQKKIQPEHDARMAIFYEEGTE